MAIIICDGNFIVLSGKVVKSSIAEQQDFASIPFSSPQNTSKHSKLVHCVSYPVRGGGGVFNDQSADLCTLSIFMLVCMSKLVDGSMFNT